MADSYNTFEGYHGTLQAQFKSINREGFHLSTKVNEWLGPGIYFFAEYENAVWWAQNQVRKASKNGKVQKPFVIRVAIRYKDDQYLDLDLHSDRQQYEQLVAKLELKLKEQKKKIPTFNSNAHRRCFYSKLLFRSTSVKILSCTLLTGYDDFGVPYNRRQHCVAGNDYIEILSGEVV